MFYLATLFLCDKHLLKKESKYKVTRKTIMTEKELLKILSEIEIFIKESKENNDELNKKLDKIMKDIGE